MNPTLLKTDTKKLTLANMVYYCNIQMSFLSPLDLLSVLPLSISVSVVSMAKSVGWRLCGLRVVGSHLLSYCCFWLVWGSIYYPYNLSWYIISSQKLCAINILLLTWHDTTWNKVVLSVTQDDATIKWLINLKILCRP